MAYANPNPYYSPKPPQQYGQVGNQSMAQIQQPQPDFSKLPPPTGPAASYTPPTGNSSFSAQQATSAVGGGLTLASNAISMAGQRLGLDTTVAPVQYDQSMKPTYTGGQLSAQAANAKPQGTTWEEVLTNAGTGAAAGVSFGGIGAAVGAVVGVGAALIGGGERKKKQRREKNRAIARAARAANEYNQADVSFRNRSAVMEDYNQKMSGNNRLYNLYRAQY